MHYLFGVATGMLALLLVEAIWRKNIAVEAIDALSVLLERLNPIWFHLCVTWFRWEYKKAFDKTLTDLRWWMRKKRLSGISFRHNDGVVFVGPSYMFLLPIIRELRHGNKEAMDDRSVLPWRGEVAKTHMSMCTEKK